MNKSTAEHKKAHQNSSDPYSTKVRMKSKGYPHPARETQGFQQKADNSDKVLHMKAIQAKADRLSSSRYEALINSGTSSQEQQADTFAQQATGHKLAPSNDIALSSAAENKAKEGLQGTGTSLPKNLQHDLGGKMGTDLSGVKIHTDSKANKSAASINARAFTVGNNIAFGAGEYQPGTTEGQALIAHEVAHVGQGGDQVKGKWLNGTDEYAVWATELYDGVIFGDIVKEYKYSIGDEHYLRKFNKERGNVNFPKNINSLHKGHVIYIPKDKIAKEQKDSDEKEEEVTLTKNDENDTHFLTWVGTYLFGALLKDAINHYLLENSDIVNAYVDAHYDFTSVSKEAEKKTKAKIDIVSAVLSAFLAGGFGGFGEFLGSALKNANKIALAMGEDLVQATFSEGIDIIQQIVLPKSAVEIIKKTPLKSLSKAYNIDKYLDKVYSGAQLKLMNKYLDSTSSFNLRQYKIESKTAMEKVANVFYGFPIVEQSELKNTIELFLWSRYIQEVLTKHDTTLGEKTYLFYHPENIVIQRLISLFDITGYIKQSGDLRKLKDGWWSSSYEIFVRHHPSLIGHPSVDKDNENLKYWGSEDTKELFKWAIDFDFPKIIDQQVPLDKFKGNLNLLANFGGK